MTDYAHNGHAQDARLTKACWIMDALFAAGASSADARRLDGLGRRRAEAAAGTRKGSEETWALVFGLMEREEAVRAQRAGRPLARSTS